MTAKRKKLFTAVALTVFTIVAGLLTATGPASANPTDCWWGQTAGYNGQAWGRCNSGSGLYWMQASCGTSSINPVYVAIGRKYSPGSYENSRVGCGHFGANYLISAAMRTSN